MMIPWRMRPAGTAVGTDTPSTSVVLSRPNASSANATTPMNATTDFAIGPATRPSQTRSSTALIGAASSFLRRCTDLSNGSCAPPLRSASERHGARSSTWQLRLARRPLAELVATSAVQRDVGPRLAVDRGDGLRVPVHLAGVGHSSVVALAELDVDLRGVVHLVPTPDRVARQQRLLEVQGVDGGTRAHDPAGDEREVAPAELVGLVGQSLPTRRTPHLHRVALFERCELGKVARPEGVRPLLRVVESGEQVVVHEPAAGHRVLGEVLLAGGCPGGEHRPDRVAEEHDGRDALVLEASRDRDGLVALS